jgi:hypothetical protein
MRRVWKRFRWRREKTEFKEEGVLMVSSGDPGNHLAGDEGEFIPPWDGSGELKRD